MSSKSPVIQPEANHQPQCVAELGSDHRLLLERHDNECIPCLENRVAYQWELDRGLLAHRNGKLRDDITLHWACDSLKDSDAPRVLDIGCAYGNLLLMLHARLGKPSQAELVGHDLDRPALAFGQVFADHIPGYQTCRFEFADLAQGLDLADASFDLVILNDVLEHMEQPADVLADIYRVLRPGGRLILCTPFESSLFKRLARLANKLSGGRVAKRYYAGKDAELDEHGEPVMKNAAGHGHISEMNWKALRQTVEAAGFAIADRRMMSVMSGSRWFDAHPFALGLLLWLEGLHDRLQLPSWAHGVMLLLEKK